jgi:hypothetical protein
VLPSDSRNVRPERRARRRTHLAAPERLESRELLVSNALGFSLPDLTITGSAGTRAAWGGSLGIEATVINQGTSTITNPIAQAPGTPSTADAPASTVAVVITPHRSFTHGVTIGTFQAPPISQNSLEQIIQTFTLPARPAGFAAPGGRFFVHLIVNSTGSVLVSSHQGDRSAPIPVQIGRTALPELRATALNVPPTMNPGDTIQPTITITNLGTQASGPVEVALVASTTRSFTVGSSIVALYDITSSIAPASQVPTVGTIPAFSQTTSPPNNSITFTGPSVTLPTSPGTYFLGVVVDPYGLISQLSLPSNALELIQTVGPNTSGLPPAGVVSTANTNPFPIAASGVFIGINPTITTSSTNSKTTTSFGNIV